MLRTMTNNFTSSLAGGFARALLLLAALLVGVTVFAEKDAPGASAADRKPTLLVLYEDPNDASDKSIADRAEWMKLATTINGEDSSVVVTRENCLAETCESGCGSKQIHHPDGWMEFIVDEEAAYVNILRYVVNVLDAFRCTEDSILSCTTETEFAKEATEALTIDELEVLEEEVYLRLTIQQNSTDASVLLRKWVVAQAILSFEQHKRRRPMTPEEANFLHFIQKAPRTYLGPTVWPVDDENGVRGVIADRNILPGDVLFMSQTSYITPSVARSFLYRMMSETESEIYKKEEDSNWGPFFEMVAFLTVHAELGKDSPLHPYIAMLRESVGRGIFGWSKEELSRLKDEAFVKGANGVAELQEKYFHKWGDRLRMRAEKWHFEVFQWAFHVVTSRSFELQQTTLIPYVDMYNHDEDAGDSLQFESREDDGAIVVRSRRVYRRGSPIVIKYVNKDYAHLLYAYGFVPRVGACPRHANEGSSDALIEYFNCAKTQLS